MKDTTPYLSEEQTDRVATPNAGPYPSSWLDLGFESPAGQLWSTGNDLAKFLAAIMQFDGTFPSTSPLLQRTA